MAIPCRSCRRVADERPDLGSVDLPADEGQDAVAGGWAEAVSLGDAGEAAAAKDLVVQPGANPTNIFKLVKHLRMYLQAYKPT